MSRQAQKPSSGLRLGALFVNSLRRPSFPAKLTQAQVGEQTTKEDPSKVGVAAAIRPLLWSISNPDEDGDNVMDLGLVSTYFIMSSYLFVPPFQWLA